MEGGKERGEGEGEGGRGRRGGGGGGVQRRHNAWTSRYEFLCQPPSVKIKAHVQRDPFSLTIRLVTAYAVGSTFSFLTHSRETDRQTDREKQKHRHRV